MAYACRDEEGSTGLAVASLERHDVAVVGVEYVRPGDERELLFADRRSAEFFLKCAQIAYRAAGFSVVEVDDE